MNNPDYYQIEDPSENRSHKYEMQENYNNEKYEQGTSNEAKNEEMEQEM